MVLLRGLRANPIVAMARRHLSLREAGRAFDGELVIVTLLARFQVVSALYYFGESSITCSSSFCV